MLNMKSATIRQIQHNLNQILSWVEKGEEVHILRRKQLVAKIVPAVTSQAKSPDFLSRAQKVWGTGRGRPLSALVAEDRGER